MNSHRSMNCECLIVGGGPAGLTGALYLARFLRSVVLVDAGKSRAAAIPKSHNHPGFIHGVTGKALLRTLRIQAEEYGAKIVCGTVLSLKRVADGFAADTSAGRILAPRVLLATGITDKCPAIEVLHQTATNDRVRYCPVCDGFEAIDKKIGVYGPPDHAAGKARFLRVYSSDVTLVPSQAPDAKLEPKHGDFELVSSAAARIAGGADGVDVALQDGRSMRFDVLYPAMGCQVHSDLAAVLGAKTNETGCLVVDHKQQTTVRGIYAAGDVVSDLHQLVVAEAHAAVAATAIHNSLPLNFR
jgi:thioredoxin reductase (NADPH)